MKTVRRVGKDLISRAPSTCQDIVGHVMRLEAASYGGGNMGARAHQLGCECCGSDDGKSSCADFTRELRAILALAHELQPSPY